MMNGQAQQSGLVMGLDTHMIAGSRACSTSTRLTHPTITNQTTPHFAGALTDGPSASTADLPPHRAGPRDHTAPKENTMSWTGFNSGPLTAATACSWLSRAPAANSSSNRSPPVPGGCRWRPIRRAAVRLGRVLAVHQRSK
jgi:hypothetical protein